MNRRLFASLVALAIGGVSAAAFADSSDVPSTSDVRVGEIGSSAQLPGASEAVPLERVVRDHRKVRDDDGDSKRESLKEKIKDKVKDKVSDKVKEKVEKEKDKIKDKISDKIDDWFDSGSGI